MSTNKENRLSSDTLFHYTSKLENLKSILKDGLEHHLIDEKLPHRGFENHNYIVCFCDILLENASYHKKVYGNYAIGLTKEWGINNKVTPMRYIHNNSIGGTLDYAKIKSDFR